MDYISAALGIQFMGPDLRAYCGLLRYMPTARDDVLTYLIELLYMTLAKILPREFFLSKVQDASSLIQSDAGWIELRPERSAPIVFPQFAGKHSSDIAAQGVYQRNRFRIPPLTLSKYSDVQLLPHQFILADPEHISGDSCEEPVTIDDGIWYYDKQAISFKGQNICFPRVSAHPWHSARNIIDISPAFDIAETMIDSPVLSIMSWYPTNVSHWLVDLLPRLWVLPYLSDVSFKLMIPEATPPFVWESLLLMGFRSENVIQFSNNDRYRIRELYVPSRVASHYTFFSPEIVDFYRSLPARILGFTPDPDPDEKVYISRSDAKRRRCFNEAEFETYLVDLGFRIVTLTELSFVERIKLFAGVKFLMGSAGAGLAHSLMMPDGTDVFVTGSPEMHKNSSLFLNIASQKSQRVTLMSGEQAADCTGINADWSLDIPNTLATLERALALRGA